MIRNIKHISDEIILGVWQINEDTETLKTELSEEESRQTAHFHPHKLSEFIVSRKLVRAMCEELGISYAGLKKDKHGKPFLTNCKYHLSISHSYPVVAAMIHKSSPCGIDIERPREQLIRVKNKFLNSAEIQNCRDNLEKLCLHWSAKEAIYKIHGRKNLSFKGNIDITNIDSNTIRTKVWVDEHEKTITLFFEKMEQYLLVYGYGRL